MSDGFFGRKQYWLLNHLIFSQKIDWIISPRQIERVYIKINADEWTNFSSKGYVQSISVRQLKLNLRMIKLEYFYDFITKNSLSKELYAKKKKRKMFRYYLVSLTQAVVIYLTQQKYGIRRKRAFVRQKNCYYLKTNREKKNSFWYVFCWKNFLIVFYDWNNY